MIIQRLDLNMFIQAFKDMGRGDQFSYSGLDTLFHFYEDISADVDEPYQIDVVELCVEWTEYDNKAAQEQLGHDTLDGVIDSYMCLVIDADTILVSE